MDNINKEAQEIVNKLTLVRDEFIKNKEELSVSIRKDIVCANLKDLLKNNTDYNSLKNGIEKYIQQLLDIKGVENKDEG